MKTKLLLSVFIIWIIFLPGCTDKDMFLDQESAPELKSSVKKLKIAIVSDIHYMDHSLLPAIPGENAAFQQLLFTSYNKMVEMSEPIFLQALAEIKNEKPDVLLIPGDLAFNGELINHLLVKAKLQELADRGIQVLVIPGNNDINSPDAASFEGNSSVPVDNISAEDFGSIYGNFGYNDALYRDENSLSYFFQLRNDLWILGIDACIYSPANKRSGAINPNTLIWIQKKMAEANENGITVLAMMHHGITEHYAGQSTLIKGDVVNDFANVSASLMNAGIKLIFTGHSHATDIVEIAANGKSILDIETGSLITPQSPYRVMTLDDNFIKIESKRITHINAPMPKGKSFLTYSDSYLAEHINLFFSWYLVNVFKLPAEVAEASMPCLKTAMMAQFAGDEKLLPPEVRKIEELNELFPGNPVVPIIYSFWTDLSPADGSIHIKIK